MEMIQPTEHIDFQLILDEIEGARLSLGPEFGADLTRVQQQSSGISDLMMVARELAEPQPIYFTRG
jgi:hypothetical protein